MLTGTLKTLPAPAVAPPQLPSGLVRLFRDDNWSSNSFDISTDAQREGVRHSLVGSNMQDAATYVAFNLPAGTVLTLMDNDTPVKSGSTVMNLDDCGRCIDLIGTGQTEAVDLSRVNMNDCASAYFWRVVDLDVGAVELFEDANFGGNRNVIFLAEWPSASVISIGNWWLNDRISSARWSALDDRQMFNLYENADGSGRAYENIQGWGKTREVSTLASENFNDAASAFRWDGIAPQKEEVEPFTVIPDMNGASGVELRGTAINNTDQDTHVPVDFTDTESQSLTVTSTDTQVVEAGVSVETSMGYTGGGVSAGVKVTVSLKFSYTHTKTTTSTDTKTVSFHQTLEVEVPARSTRYVLMTLDIGKLPQTTYQTTATRWYDREVTGSAKDPLNHNWYKRVEQVTGTISGGIAGKFLTTLDSKPPSN